MNKLLLCMLMAGLMMPAMAQKNSDVVIEGWTVAGTSNSYDRQTQGAVYPMTKRHSDGFIASTWTNDDNSDFPESNNPKRGVGYAYSTNNGQTWSTQEKRVGGIPLYWPSYAQWGANGEAILARSADTHVHQGVAIKNGLVLLTRSNKGVGEWTITPVPYPTGTSPEAGYTMAWARMTTSGNNHQYIHIMSPIQLPQGQTYNNYANPVFYYRTQDGGSTWNVAGKLVPTMVGQEWEVHSEYNDAITFADTEGDVVACSFIKFGCDSHVLRSYNNGTTWESIDFFDSPVGYYHTLSQYADTCFIPSQGCIALDNNGKIHVAFSVLMAKNSASGSSLTLFKGFAASFLSYWNEDMGTIDGATEFVNHKIDPLFDDYFDWNLSSYEKLYVKSTVPKWPIIGFYTPTQDDHYFTLDMDVIKNWATTSYGNAGCFSFPQMTFDRDNTLHLTYLGLLDYGDDGNNHWLRRPFYTVTNGGAIWGKTKYLVNNINLMDQELAYLTLAGIDNNTPKQWIYLMAQVDPLAGTFIAGDHSAKNNSFYHFRVQGDDVESCYPVTAFAVDYTEDCKAKLTWNAPESGNFTYKIYRDSNLVATLNNATLYTDEGFNTTVKHTWKVTVVCGSGESVPASVTKDPCELPPCNEATDASATISNCKTATITWKAVTGAKEYKISRDGVEATVTTPKYTENDTFEHGKSYTWQIVTICEYGKSNPIEATATANCPPPDGINELADHVAIYPNPTTGMIVIEVADFLKVEIYNTIGQLIETKTVNAFDVSSYNTGIYFFKVYNINNNSVIKRVVVTK